jgi:hypothetical protein
MNPPEVEIRLRQSDTGEYEVEVRGRYGDGDVIPPPEGARINSINFKALNAAWEADPTRERYAQTLTQQVFTEQAAEFLKTARAAAGENPLRIRLLVAPSAAKLHGLRWELLLDPNTHKPLAEGRTSPFARYLSSPVWRSAGPRPKAELRALIAVANPADLGNLGLRPLQVKEEVEWATQALAAAVPAVVKGPKTLDQMAKLMTGEEFDIILLVCHGGWNERSEEAVLYLEGNKVREGEHGKAEPTVGGEIVRRLTELGYPARLVVLATCFGAGPGAEQLVGDEKGATAAVGPKLAEAGVPAVLALQGRARAETVQTFLKDFFAEVTSHGEADTAASVARLKLADQHDRWVPVLYTRIRHGRIWSLPNEVPPREKQFEGWKGLVSAIHEGKCTPILGPGLLEGLVGPTREFARRWAMAEEYALAPYQQEDLPHVLQFLAVCQGRTYPLNKFAEKLCDEVLRRFRPVPAAAEDPVAVLAGAAGPGAVDGPADPNAAAHRADQLLGKALADACRRQRKKRRAEPHGILARLPFPMYLTTNPDTLLEWALDDAGKPFDFGLCRWREPKPEEPEWPKSPFAAKGYSPSATRPLVYHLYGRLDYPGSLVLTEDDYFDYLTGIGVDRGKPQGDPTHVLTTAIPRRVRRTFVENALVFLGFRIEEWDFKVLLRSIMTEPVNAGRERLTTEYPHIAVQIEPEEGRNANPEEARRYLQKYFSNANITLYWGTVEDFARDLRKHWNRTYPNQKIPEEAP